MKIMFKIEKLRQENFKFTNTVTCHTVNFFQKCFRKKSQSFATLLEYLKSWKRLNTTLQV